MTGKNGKIDDLDQFESWLKKQNIVNNQEMAARAALRSLPAAMAVVDQPYGSDGGDRFVLYCFRAILNAAIASVFSSSDSSKMRAIARSIIDKTRPKFVSSEQQEVRSTKNRADRAQSTIAHAPHSPAANAARSASAHAQSTAAAKSERSAAMNATAAFIISRTASPSGRPSRTFSVAGIMDANSIISRGPKSAFLSPLWPASRHVAKLEDDWHSFKERLDREGTWAFWVAWYQGFLDGKPLDWKLQRRVALIEDDTWEDGPEAVAQKIREIEAEFTSTSAHVSETTLFSDEKLASVARAATQNSHVIALTGAGVTAQVQDFRETVRGRNDLEPDLSEDLLELLDSFVSKLDELVKRLPDDHQTADHEDAHGLLLWWRDYSRMMKTKAAKYVSAENVSDVTLPAGIVLGSTAIGGLLGQPLAGSVVGGLIANQIKPGQAAKELLKPSTDNTTAN